MDIKKQKKRFLAILLVLVIMVTSFPLNVFAVDNSEKQEELADIIPNPEENIEKPSEDYVNVSFASYQADVNTTPAQNTGGKIVYEGKEYEKVSFWVKKGVKYSHLMKEIVPSDDYFFNPTAEDATNRPSVKIADKKALDFISWSPGLGYHGNKNGDGEIVDETVEAAITRILGEGKESITHHAKWAAPILPYTPFNTDNPVNDTDAKTEKDKLPENYVDLYKVIGFNTDGNGKLVVNDEEKEAQSYLVLYKLKWDDIQNIIPKTKGKPDFTFDKWDEAVPTTGAVANKSSYKALFKDGRDIIPDPGNNIPKPSEDYVKVTFLPGDHGKLNGTEYFWVKKGTTFPSNMAPQITPNSGYSVAPQRWNPTLPMLIEVDTTFTAVYNKDASTNIPEVPTPQPKPEPKPQEPIRWGSFIPVAAPQEKLEMDGIHHAYIFGYPNGTVQPDGKITRAEAAAMLARLKGLDLDNGFAPNFKDTKNDAAWYNKVINAVVKAGYMRGYPDGTFKPENSITRAEFAQMIMPIDKANSAVAPFEDVKGHWGEVAINQGYGNKRLHGYPDGTFRPDADITRAEAAKIFNRLFDRLVTEQGLRTLENPKDLKHFTDLDTRHWGYYELLEATNTHEYFRLEKGGVEEGWIRVLNH